MKQNETDLKSKHFVLKYQQNKTKNQIKTTLKHSTLSHHNRHRNNIVLSFIRGDRRKECCEKNDRHGHR